jgi:hypothetical protein
MGDCAESIDAAEQIPDECEHEWAPVKDWYGDSDVPGGTADCSFFRCTLCGDEDHDRRPTYSDFHNQDEP